MNQEELRQAFTSAGKNHGAVLLGGKQVADTELANVLSEFPNYPQVREITLSGTQVGDRGVEALAQAAEANSFPRLKRLNLPGTQVGNQGVEAIARAAKNQGFSKLVVLALANTKVGNQGVEALAQAAEANGFPRLRMLGLDDTLVGNRGGEMLAHIGKFPQLYTLKLANTPVGNEGMAALARGGNLPQLRVLDLSGTQVGDQGLEALAQAVKANGLPQLQVLDLSGTQAGDQGVESLAQAAEANGFQQLRVLCLNRTQVGNQGVEALAQAVKANGFPQLQSLQLDRTRVTIALEELRTRDPHRIFQALKGASLSETKVLLLGEPAVGKTWLCRRIFKKRIPKTREETHDIQLVKSKWKPRVADLDVSLRVWDFGGQHVLHGTHEIFLTKRSVAILVLDATRSPEENKVDYWIKFLCHFAGQETPLIVVVSKCDDENPVRQITQIDLTELPNGLTHVPQVINGFSALTPLPKSGKPENQIVEALRGAVANALGRIDGLHDLFSLDTARMKDRVERELAGRTLVSLKEYHNWCRAEKVDDRNGSILRTLDNLGALFFFGLTEREKSLDESWFEELPPGQRRFYQAQRDTILNNWIVNPHWVKWPIYEVIRRSADSRRTPSGVMTFNDIKDAACQGASDHNLEMPQGIGPEFICKLLQLIGLSWELPPRAFLFPRGLPDDRPYGCDEWETRAWWEWHFLPEDCFHRFIVRMHERKNVVKGETSAWLHWRSAVVIEFPAGCRAVILADMSSGRLEARLDPSSPQKERFPELSAFVGDVFESEFVGRPADRKELPVTVGAAAARPEYAPMMTIYKALVAYSVPIPAKGHMSRWQQDKKIQKQIGPGGAALVHIDQTMDRYAAYYARKEKQPLEDVDRRRIVNEIIHLMQQGRT